MVSLLSAFADTDTLHLPVCFRLNAAKFRAIKLFIAADISVIKYPGLDMVY